MNGNHSLYVLGKEDDFGDGYFSYVCPQAIVEVNCGRWKYRHCTVKMRNFPFTRLAPYLLPGYVARDNLRGEDALYAAVYYGLCRFAERLGNLRVTVYSDNVPAMRCLAAGENGNGWLRAISSVKWDGVQFERMAQQEIEKVIEARRY